MTRREALEAISAAVGAAVAAACGSNPNNPSGNSSTGGSTSSTCAVIPSETEGPYADVLNMVNNPAFYRRDVTEGKPGLALALTMTVVNVNNGCSPLANMHVEIWHCDASGNYSEYSQPGFNGVGQTFLRGLQTSDASGQVTFNTIYPGWYAGRATHIHVDVYRANGTLLKTTQIAFPESVSSSVYRTGVYATKGQNPTTNTGDNVFADGTSQELATLAGSTSSGYTAALQIGVAA